MEVRISVPVTTHNQFEPKMRVLTGQFQDLGNVISTKNWCPVVFKNNYRLKENFLEATAIVLDIDEGWDLEDAINQLTDYNLNFIVGTTRHHRLPKTTAAGIEKPACDRFRVVIETAGSCTSLETFEYTMKILSQIFPTDSAVANPAQPYKPCEIYKVYLGGNLFQWAKKPESVKKQELRIKEQQTKRIMRHRAEGTIPNWIKEKIQNGVKPPLSRHRTCYRIGLELTKLGYLEKEIVQAILTGPLKHIGADHVERAVRNGAEKIIGKT